MTAMSTSITEWEGFESQRDLVAGMIYNARSLSTREMTPERWSRVKAQFRTSAQHCLDQADEMIEDGEFE